MNVFRTLKTEMRDYVKRGIYKSINGLKHWTSTELNVQNFHGVHKTSRSMEVVDKTDLYCTHYSRYHFGQIKNGFKIRVCECARQ